MLMVVQFSDATMPGSVEFGPVREVELNGDDLHATYLDGERRILASRCKQGGWHVRKLEQSHFRCLKVLIPPNEVFDAQIPNPEDCGRLGSRNPILPPF